jgi:N-acetylated-alpha-linked acidic dipeptidase
MTARPHHLGSPYGKEIAEWMAAQFRQWGWETAIETFEVLFPTPKERALELVAPVRFTARLEEPALAADPTSAQKTEQLPTYNAYSADGEATAPLVYVNYGTPEDYERLDRMGVSVKGAIVIARYGGSWRGIKPKLAAERGALGCLIYSDPQNDGYAQGDVYPQGPYRPKDGVQRGSVMDMPLYPGDPLTPGIGAVAGAKRLPLGEAPTLTRVPVLPISYADAQPLLAAIGGPVAPANWRGSLPITYKVGPGPARVRLKVKSSWDTVKLYNVVARLRGAKYADEWVLRGNHHDAWVYGADDPVSAMSAMLEEARAFGELVKRGWRPRRTIVYLAWDGEEQALLGSTEWAELHADELRQKSVAYINSDSNGRGFLRASGSHTLEKFINAVARDITDPAKKISVWERLKLERIANARGDDRKEVRERADLRIGALGSGSDYTAFIDHLGIASLNLAFGGEDGGGIYHSIYDSLAWYTKFSDGEFVYGRALAQTAGTAVLRLADAELLPFAFRNFADTIGKYAEEVEKLYRETKEEIAENNRQIKEGVFQAISGPRETMLPPAEHPLPPDLDFKPLHAAVEKLKRSAAAYDDAAGKWRGASAQQVNAQLIRSERLLTRPEGLAERPWFKHQIYAPGFYTGYGVKTLPGVREAIEQKRWSQAQAEIARVSTVLEEQARLVDAAAGGLR